MKRMSQIAVPKDPISLSYEEDVWANDEEIQLSMSSLIFSNLHLINYI